MSSQVNRPTDERQKEQDVARKLQLYGIYKAFEAGKIPSNDQIDVSLNSFLASHALAQPHAKLSGEGKGLVKQFRSVVEQAKLLFLTKNSGEILQDFIWHCEKMDGGAAGAPVGPLDQQTVQQHGKQVKDGLRTLGQLVITNGEFRKLLNDAVVLLRDIAGDAATNAAGKVNPSEDQLNQMDRPADDNVWHETPDMSSGNVKSQMKQTFKKNAPVDKGDVKDAVGNASQNAHPNGSRDPADAARLAGHDQQYDNASGVDGRAGARAGVDTLKQRASDNVPEETKQRGRETRDRAKNYLDEKMPKERREQLIYRLKKMVVEIQGHQDYMKSVTTLLDLAEEYAGHAQTAGQQGSGAVKNAHGDASLKTAETDLKTLLERFANYTSSDDLIDSINAIYADADRDPELKSWFKQMNSFIRRCLQEQGFIMEDECTQRWNELYDRGNFLLRERYRPHTDRIVDEIKFLANEFDNDKQNREFAEACEKLFNDLGHDENGKPKFKKHLFRDVTDVILPGVYKRIRYMPIPRLEYRDPKTELVIENLVIESNNLTPNLLDIAQEKNIRLGREGFQSENKGSVTIDVAGIQMDLKDISYYFKRHTSFPIHGDQGIIDVFLGGSGLSFKLKLSIPEKKDRQHLWKVDSVKVNIKNFNLKVKQSKHKILFTAGKSLMIKPLTKAIGKAVELAIKQKFEEADAFAYRVKVQADRAKEEAAKNPENVPNIYRNYVSAFQRELTKGQAKAQKAQEAVQDKEFKMVLTMEDSMFPNVKLPGGITEKATEYKNLAHSGNSWGSNVFGLGSAQPSNHLASPRKVERKPHSVAQGGVKGPQNIGNTSSMNGSGNQSSYNQNAQQGYGQSSTQQGYGQSSTQQGYGQQGFNQQVDKAFGNAAHHTHTDSGISNASNGQKIVASNGGHTLLGANNPVFSGKA